MSSNLDFPQLTENQANPEITVNDIAAALDAAVTETFTANVTSGNVSLTNSQFRLMARVNVTNATVGGRTVTVPAIKRLFIITSESANTQNISLVRGSTTVAISPGEARFCMTDGTANGLVTYAIGSVFDVITFHPGLLVNGQFLYKLNTTRPFTLPINLTGSIANTEAGGFLPTGSFAITIRKNGSSIGTINFVAATQAATFTFASAVSFAVADVLSLTGPVTADASAADIGISLKGLR